jgi:hypothetical protein
MRRALLRVAALTCLATVTLSAYAFTRNIMLTGYWPVTNEMLRRFSNNPAQNPQGWIGENWEGRGYNIYAFFPEFPAGTFPVGVGDFTVDYQDTSEDWWRITNEVKPVSIITFSRGSTGSLWEIETRQRNLVTWVDDYVAPFQPTPAPPDASMAPNGIRFSSLPTAKIASAVNAAGLGITAVVDTTGYGGGFLSEFIAYHGCWYRDMHIDATDPDRCFMSGHIHVGTAVSQNTATIASQISLRTMLSHLDTLVPEPSSVAVLGLGVILVGLLRRRR